MRLHEMSNTFHKKSIYIFTRISHPVITRFILFFLISEMKTSLVENIFKKVKKDF